MPGDDGASVFPDSLVASRENPALRYRLVKSHFAVHGSERQVDAKDAVLHFAAENIAVHASAKRASVAIAPSDSESAVYESTAGGSLSVPTGWIYVRFAKGSKIEDKAAALDAAGYRIVRNLSYAPNAAWVTAADGGVAASVNGISKLDAISGIEEVAPQMLSKAARKE
jgi:hypothetical protein